MIELVALLVGQNPPALAASQPIEILNIVAKPGGVSFRVEKPQGTYESEAYIVYRRLVDVAANKLQWNWAQQAQGLVERDRRRKVSIADVKMLKEGTYRIEMGDERAYLRVSRVGFAGWEKSVQYLFGLEEELKAVATELDQAPARVEPAAAKGFHQKLGAIRRRWKQDVEFAASCKSLSDSIEALNGCRKLSGLVMTTEMPKATGANNYNSAVTPLDLKAIEEERQKRKNEKMIDAVRFLPEVITREAVLYLLEELELVLGTPGPMEGAKPGTKPKSEIWIIRWAGFDGRSGYQLGPDEPKENWTSRWSSKTTAVRQIAEAYRSMRIKYEIGEWFDTLRENKDPDAPQTLKEWRTRLLTMAIQ